MTENCGDDKWELSARMDEYLEFLSETEENSKETRHVLDFEDCNGKKLHLTYVNKSLIKRLISKLTPYQSDEQVTGLVSDSDVISGLYEGGFKVWECTRDVLHFLADLQKEDTHNHNVHHNFFQGKRVLDLGCGSGLIGILCLMMGAESVTFHDFNPEVIKFFTLTNILLNLLNNHNNYNPHMTREQLKKEVEQKVCFLSGDWKDFPPLTQSFDVIVSSETIYNEDSYENLIRIIDRHLKPTSGKTFIAAKTYYFGVGGGTRSFEDFIRSSGTSLTSSVIKIIPASVQREILQVTKE